MAHNLDFSKGKAAFAFRGNREDVWHKLGQQHQEGWSMDDWREQAGLDYEVLKVPALADLREIDLQRVGGGRFLDDYKVVAGDNYLVRSDTGGVLGHVKGANYHIVQPKEVLDWFERYVGVDERFKLDAAGAIKDGKVMWATATYNGEMDVAGDAHVARLLMTTGYDGTRATWNRATMTRVVCNNTLDAAMADKTKAYIRTPHSQRFDAKKVGAELAQIVQSFEQYKQMGEAMALRHISQADTERLFKQVLDWPAENERVSTRKQNQFAELMACMEKTIEEGREPDRMWTAMNALTRYLDHNRGSNTEKRFASANFGDGARLKQKGVEFLIDLSDGDLLRAVGEKTADVRVKDGNADLSDIMKGSFKPRFER